jgi:hypothetical protein
MVCQGIFPFVKDRKVAFYSPRPTRLSPYFRV